MPEAGISSGKPFRTRKIFLSYTGSLLPFGLMLWMAFVIPMLLREYNLCTAIGLSDPFGWGWDFFGTANTPWHQFLPRYIPWIQALLILTGLHLSLRNIIRSWREMGLKPGTTIVDRLPYNLSDRVTAVGLLFFFTN